MEQPIPTFTPSPHTGSLLDALRVERSALTVTVYENGLPHVYVLLGGPADVAALQPDLAAMARLARESGAPIVGFNVFAGAASSWKTRMFAPADGDPEDAATGSAAGPLAPHLARHGLIPRGEEIRISQGAEIGRPSTLSSRVAGSDDHVEKIELSGFAVAVGGDWFRGDVLRAADVG